MSFKNSMQATQKFLLKWTKGKPEELVAAVLAARQFNQTIVETDLGNGEAGKTRQLKVSYYPPVETDNGTGSESICDSGTVLSPKQVFFEIKQTTSSAVYQLNKNDIKYVDGAYKFSDHAKAQIASVLPTVRHKHAVEMAELIVANVGLLPNGNASQLLPLLDKSNGTVNPMGLWEIERAYRDSGYGNPFIVGGTDVFHWKKAVEIGGLNNLGQNIAALGRTNAYYDSLVNTTFGDTTTEHIISFDPQMLKFVSFNNNAGIFATDLDNIDAIDAIYQRGGTDYIEGVMADPVTGLLWDLNVNYDKCNSRWTFQWKLQWDIFFMPSMVAGNKQGVNSIFHWTTCVQKVVECETGSVLTPASSTTFEYDTNGHITYPLIAQKVEIAGQTYFTTVDESSLANITALRNLLNSIQTGLTFTVSGTNLRYTGYAGITVVINDTLTMTFE